MPKKRAPIQVDAQILKQFKEAAPPQQMTALVESFMINYTARKQALEALKKLDGV